VNLKRGKRWVRVADDDEECSRPWETNSLALNVSSYRLG